VLLRDNGRSSGILLAISSLPSNYGIGTLGIESYRFIDFLVTTKQKYWQLLPLVPLGEGNSPYKSPSCYAGEILYIDLDFLITEGLLSPSDIGAFDFPKDVDYEAVRNFKLPIIRKATENFDTDNEDYRIFCRENDYWLEDYATFMAALKAYNTEFLYMLPKKVKERDKKTVEELKRDNADEIRFHKVSQYFFYAQLFELKRYAKQKNIKLIGDIPFYVSPDSADVWANPQNFLLCGDFKPSLVAGVPPDYFSKTGQLWGNPIYDFEYLREHNYDWWIKRLKHYFSVFDVVRIDHFRAFADYYTIPYGSEDAVNGKWEIGVGTDFWNTAQKYIKNMKIIAEDLGAVSPLVEDLVSKTGFPNMKVLQFGFSGDDTNPHLPKNYPNNCVCYTGTHDNDTMLGFYNSCEPYEKEKMDELYPETESMPVPLNFIEGAMKSNAETVIIPMQDWLMSGTEARMNIPGVPKGNWTFRIEKNYIDDNLINRVLKISKR